MESDQICIYFNELVVGCPCRTLDGGCAYVVRMALHSCDDYTNRCCVNCAKLCDCRLHCVRSDRLIERLKEGS